MDYTLIECPVTIKREDLKDDYDIFLFAHLDNITNNLVNGSNDIPFGTEVDMSQQYKASLPQQPQLLENPLPNIVDDKENGLTQLLQSQSDVINNTSHFVRYKMQDGKHVKIWECGICQKMFTHQYTLMRHLPTHTDERKFQCITCGKGNLRNHIFTHTNERPYKCDICEKGFNQMSNLMCHKLKAHQRTEKPKYVCQVCGKSFPKRVGLRQHEQFTHQMVNPPSPTPPTKQVPDKINYSNAILVEPIKTEAMRIAIESNQTPFALLRPVTGIPVLVRVLPAGDKQMLVPASAEDLKKHSHISIRSKGDKPSPDGKQVGSTVQIKIPVVATVIQQNDQAGQMSMSIVSPGPNGELGDQTGLMGNKSNNFVYSSTLTNCGTSTSAGSMSTEINIEDIPITGDFTHSDIMQDVAMQFLDENKKIEDNQLQAPGVPNQILYTISACKPDTNEVIVLDPDDRDVPQEINPPPRISSSVGSKSNLSLPII